MAPCQPTDQEIILLDETQRAKFLEILIANGISDEIDSITMEEPAALKGQHMASSSVYVQIKFKDISLKPKNLFVKKFHDENSGHTAMMNQSGLMDKEAEFLREFVPDAKVFCSKYPGCENFLNFFPKCFYGDKKMVVLENLVLDDTFVMLPKEDFQDLDTAKIVLANLAKFHATTSVMIEEMGKENFVQKYKLTSTNVILGPMKQLFVKMLNDGIQTMLSILKENPVEDSDKAIGILTKYIAKGTEIFETTLKTYPEEGDKFLCLNHGDCWNNNMLFKIDSKTQKIYEHMFVDLQLTLLGSPCYDLPYYIYLSVKLETRRKHLRELLQYYYENFQSVRQAFGKECLFTFDELLEDFKRRNGFGFFTSLSISSVMASLKDVDVTKMGDNPEDIATLVSQATRNWIKQNPLKAKALAEETVISIKEHFSDSY